MLVRWITCTFFCLTLSELNCLPNCLWARVGRLVCLCTAAETCYVPPPSAQRGRGVTKGTNLRHHQPQRENVEIEYDLLGLGLRNLFCCQGHVTDMKGFRSPRPAGRASFSSGLNCRHTQHTHTHTQHTHTHTHTHTLIASLTHSHCSVAETFYRGHRRTLSNTSNISRVSFSSDHYTHTFGDRSSVSLSA